MAAEMAVATSATDDRGMFIAAAVTMMIVIVVFVFLLTCGNRRK
jgi:hypothetical protein